MTATRWTVLLLVSTLVSTSLAQTTIGGAVNDTTTPMVAGTYHVTGNLSVAGGETWTLPAGAILKFASSRQLAVSGTLLATSTIFTSFRDDSVGVDVSGPGVAIPAPGDWSRIDLNSGSGASVIDGCTISYAGATGFAAVRLTGGPSPTLNGTTIRDSLYDGMDVGDALPTVTNCAFDANRNPLVGVPVHALAAFSGNTAAGNALGDHITLNGTSVSTGDVVAISVDDTLSGTGVVGVPTSLTVADGGTLTLGPGVIWKWKANAQLTVYGELHCQGTAADEVVFTHINDDDHGGDSANDGPTQGSAGSWNRLEFRDSADASTLTHTIVRFAGSAGYGAFRLLSADISVANCTIQQALYDGFADDGTSYPAVTGCAFEQSGRYAVNGLKMAALPGFTANTGAGNGQGDYVRVTSSTVDADTTVGPLNALNGGATVLSASLTIPSGTTLTLLNGTTLKFASNSLMYVHGTLVSQGTTAAPVTITSIRDDAVAGDTNNDGNATVPAPGNWNRIDFTASQSGSVLENLHVRYAGSAGYGALRIGSDIVLRECEVLAALYDSVAVLSGALPTIEHCTFRQGGRYAMADFSWANLPLLRNNVAFGHGIGDYLRLTSGAVSDQIAVFPHNYPGDALVSAVSINVATGGSLSLTPGVILKFSVNSSITVNGSFNLAGSGVRPVVLTTIRDDDRGGDTNKDGSATTPAAGAWNRIDYAPGAAPSLCEHAEIRYSGSAGLPALRLRSPLTFLNSVTVYDALYTGIGVSAVFNDPANLVATRCRTGITLDAGSATLRHATVAESTLDGIRRNGSATGQVVNSISWNNGTDYAGFNPGDVTFSIGGASIPAHATNLSVDPLFRDPTNDDFRLQGASPAIGAAQPIAGLLKDRSEAPRSLDGNLDGTAAPDRGAYEFRQFEFEVTGQPRTTTFLDFNVTGPPGVYILALGEGNGVVPLGAFGTLFAGPLTEIFPIGPFATGTVITIGIPNDPALDGVPFGLQGLGTPLSNPAVGNLTRVFRGLIYH